MRMIKPRFQTSIAEVAAPGYSQYKKQGTHRPKGFRDALHCALGDVGHVVPPLVAAEHVEVHDIRPVFLGRDAKQREHGRP